MKERGITFKPAMVYATVMGNKRATRRLIRTDVRGCLFNAGDAWDDDYILDPGNADWRQEALPYEAGDRLYIREAYRVPATLNVVKPSELPDPLPPSHIHYELDGAPSAIFGKYRHARYMPRRLARINLAVIGCRAERLQSIDKLGAFSEGVVTTAPHDRDGRRHFGIIGMPDIDEPTELRAFVKLWDAINGTDGPKSWGANPWVSVTAYDLL